MPELYTVYTRHGAVAEPCCSLERAAYLADLGEDEVAWCLEDAGRCDTGDCTILPLGEPWKPWDGFPNGTVYAEWGDDPLGTWHGLNA